MKYKSAMTTQASGSIDGMTASRNRFGRYMRSRANPVNPLTPQQVAVRAIFAMYSQMWGSTLTDAQRATWALYGANVPVTDKLGDPINLPGNSWYIGLNVPRAQADPVGLPALTSAPSIFDQGSVTPPVVTPGAGTLLAVAFDAADAWVGETGAAMLVYTARPTSPTINYFRGPYQLAGVILGDGTTPPTTPAAVVSPFTAAVGQRVHTRITVSRADGRLTPPIHLTGIAT